jgi:group I intron endonuclease
MKKKTGIYRITNIKNGKNYVGSAIDIKKRWNAHLNALKNNKHHSKKLQNSTNKYGIENFLFEVIEECPKEVLVEREQYWIDSLNSHQNGYNSVPKAGTNFGRKCSEETKQKIRNKSIGKKMSEESREKMSKSKIGTKQNIISNIKRSNKLRGITFSEEHKKKLSKSNTGKKHSEETKQKISKSKSGVKRKSPFSEETRLKLSKSNTGKKHSEETKKKLSIIFKGKSSPLKGTSMSEETKQKMSESAKKRKRFPMSEETKQKISEKAKTRYMIKK